MEDGGLLLKSSSYRKHLELGLARLKDLGDRDTQLPPTHTKEKERERNRREKGRQVDTI